jgi:cytochrome c-type biogenesis protein CcmH
MKLQFTLLLWIFLLTAASAWATEPLVFDDLDQEARFAALTAELRCLVCQNQSLADSDAPLAQDLRQEIHQMLQSGSSNEQIKTFLVDRYGDFVLYRPPVQGNTLALWLMPLGLLLFGGMVVVLVIRRHNRLSDGGHEEIES